jgi:hypothetical protein
VDPREIVVAIVRAHAPAASFDDQAPLGAEGLGLDSIAVAEVLLECEMRFGRPCAQLLEGEPLTIARLARHVGGAAAQ